MIKNPYTTKHAKNIPRPRICNNVGINYNFKNNFIVFTPTMLV